MRTPKKAKASLSFQRSLLVVLPVLSAAVGNGVKIGRLGGNVSIFLPVVLVAGVVRDALGHGVGEEGGNVDQAILPVGRLIEAKVKQVLVDSRDRLSPARGPGACFLTGGKYSCARCDV